VITGDLLAGLADRRADICVLTADAVAPVALQSKCL
jgi:hypothetical protein